MNYPNVSLICLITEEKYDKVKKILQGRQKMRVKVVDMKTNAQHYKTVDVIYNVNETDYAGRTALMWALLQRQNEIALELLKQGAKLNVRDEYGLTPVSICVCSRNYKGLKAILSEHCPTFNRMLVNEWYGSFKSTPLYSAVNRGYYRIAALLLKAGADPNVINWEDNLPLVSPIAGSDTKMVHLLLKYDARVDLTTRNGEDLLSFSLGNNFEEGHIVSKMLLAAELKYDGYKERLEKAYQLAIKCNNTVMAEEILNVITDFPAPPKVA